ncbi:MAG TPA: hypothetical protein VFH66_11680 [Mycobacteriales bacterium]|nr:hypothetical protein [Mycobacteriales bacterium]
MNAARRTPPLLPLPLLVVGLALVVAGLRAGHAVGPAAATPLAYQPPAPAVTQSAHHPVRPAPVVTRRVHPAHRRAAATVGRHRSSEARAAVHPVATTTAPRRPDPRPPATHVFVSGPTAWSALNAAIARIPTYRTGAARWVVSTKYDFWGTADWYHDVLYVDPSVPTDKLYDVAVHEWSHELSVLDYGGDVAAATRAMNTTFGGNGLTGPERAADCMSILQGATWTHYTTCSDAKWRAAASRLIAGRTLL